MLLNIEDLREDYDAFALDETQVNPNPMQQFEVWFQQALQAEVPEPNAMTLATVNSDGQPCARIVLLKGLEPDALIFYTNYESNKGQQMSQNPKVAVVFLWKKLHRQVRIEGSVELLSAEQSTAYFQGRPKGSQIGAWVSPQSQVIESRAVLEARKQELEDQYKDSEKLPRPENWGGYQIKPTTFEFWQGRPSRLHDRIRYQLEENGSWKIERLAP